MDKKIVGIDAGYVNFAVCAINSNDAFKPYYWVNQPLFTGTFSEEKLIMAIYKWIKTPQITALLEQADLIVLERQMAKKFQAVNHCIRFLFSNKTVEVNPSTIRSTFDLPTTRKEKKKATVDLVTSNAILPIKTGKKDDLCDAFLLATHGVQRFLPTHKLAQIREVTKKQKRSTQ